MSRPDLVEKFQCPGCSATVYQEPLDDLLGRLSAQKAGVTG